MSEEFKETIHFHRKSIIRENSMGVLDESGKITMEANISVFKNKDNEWQGGCEMYCIKPEDGDNWYMECWIGFEGTMAMDYDGTSGYIPNEVLDVIDKHGFQTEDIRPSKKEGK